MIVRSSMPLRLRSFIAYMALPYVRHELPGWGKLLGQVGIHSEAIWKDAPVKSIRGKLHGYEMQMDLRNWSDRQSFFLARFYDLPTQLLIMDLVQAGDTFIDLGANIGMISMLAARLVGPSGQVHSFEPNPDAFARLRNHVDSNGLGNVTLYQFAVSDVEDELTLTVLDNHSGSGTLAPLGSEAAGHQQKSYTVPVKVVDDVLPERLSSNVIIKIDVEGFECRAIRGLKQTITRYQPAFVLEAVSGHLRRAGSSLEEMFDLLQSQGYEAFEIATRAHLLRHRLNLRPCQTATDLHANNVLWLPQGGPWRQRLASTLAYNVPDVV